MNWIFLALGIIFTIYMWRYLILLGLIAGIVFVVMFMLGSIFFGR